MKTYLAGLENKAIGLKANSLYEAKQMAVAQLKPNKRNAGLLWVIPAEERPAGPGAKMLVIDLGQLN